MIVLSFVFLAAIAIPSAYLYILAVSSMRQPTPIPYSDPLYRFAIAIPAHNEEPVIEETILSIRNLRYPGNLYDIYVVADHCTDRTAEIARRTGAICYERNELPSGSKGAALNWLLERIWETEKSYDAVVYIDADSKLDVQFLRHMNARLRYGDPAIQGRVAISNSQDGWYSMLAWAMEIIDNKLQQAGRSNLGFSVRLSGFGFCIHTSVARRVKWPTGLTEDYEFRLKLLANGIRIRYEPRAIVHSEAPSTWRVARNQQARWRVGAIHSSQRYLPYFFHQTFYRRDLSVLDAVAQMIFPSYSTLSILSVIGLFFHLILNWIGVYISPLATLGLWTFVTAILFIYPFFGLALENAPLKAYGVILTGPFFIVWRTWLALVARLSRRKVVWIRTPRGVTR